MTGRADWEDTFERFNQNNWTNQPGGLRLAEEPAPDGVTIRDGTVILDEPLKGVRLTSRRKFLYGTLEARVKINPTGYQYIGFMSRAPWGANSLMLMSESGAWQFMRGRDGKGGYAGIAVPVKDEWVILKIVWEKSRAALYVNGELKGEARDESVIPQSPLPIILDVYARHPMFIDYIKVTGESRSESLDNLPPPAPSGKGPEYIFTSSDWNVVVDRSTGVIRKLSHLKPSPLAWTPENAAGLDLYLRDLPSGRPVRLQHAGHADVRAQGSAGKSFGCSMAPGEGAFKDAVTALLEIRLEGPQLRLTARWRALRDIDHPVEIGMGLPSRAESWKRHVFPRLPWLVMTPQQDEPVRFPFLADPSDATVASSTGNWIFYPIGILQRLDRTILWGGMDVGERMVLSPNNYGSLPAITRAPKRWAKGRELELSLTLQSFPEPANELPQVLRWYLSHCRSSDPLTQDLFPVRDWTPRTFPKGGGVGMPDVRITRAEPTADRTLSDKVEGLLLNASVPNLWLGCWHKIDGSYPTSGSWITCYGRPLTAETWRSEVARLKSVGLRPCLYVNQFIIPEVCKEGGRPDRRWVAHDADGALSAFDHYVAGEGRGLGDWFTREVAEQIGTKEITLALGDYGNAGFRRWYTEQIKAAIDYYQPSGIAFDYGWAGVGPSSVYSPADPGTSQAHGRLRVQADIWKWLRAKHPEVQVIVNDIPGSPSQLFANCTLLESSDTMSDVDFLAGKALGSAMSSMDYFADHNRARWTRQMMLDLARGCSFGSPFWILANPPEATYIATWKTFLDFSGRTTRLPMMPTENAVSCVDGDADIVGAVWTDGSELMAAAFNRQTQSGEKEITLGMKLPTNMEKVTRWWMQRLSNQNVDAPETGWKVEGVKGGRLLLRGRLGAGEMLLVSSRPHKS